MFIYIKLGEVMKVLTPLKAVREKCLECSANQPKEVKLCDISDCPLYLYRFGKNPNRKGVGNPQAFLRKNDGVEFKDSFEKAC